MPNDTQPTSPNTDTDTDNGPPLQYADQVGAELAATSTANKFYTARQVQELCGISKATQQSYYKLLHLEPLKQGRESLISDRDIDAVKIVAEYMQTPAAPGQRKYPDDILQTLRGLGYSIPKSERELQQEDEDDPDQSIKISPTQKIKTPQKNDSKQILKPIADSTILNFLGAALPGILSTFSRDLGESINQKTETESLLEDFELLDKRYEILEKAADRKRKITSSDLAKILGLKAISGKGQKFTRYGFAFEKSGKSGTQIMWAVEREE